MPLSNDRPLNTGSPVLVTGSVVVSSPINVTVPQPLEVYIGGVQGISGSVAVENWPAVIGVSGTVGAVVQNWPMTLGVSGSVTVSNLPAVQTVSGGIVVQNWPALIGISASGPVQVWQQGPVGVTGSVSLTNWPAVIGVSGSATVTGSVALTGPGTSAQNPLWVTGSTGTGGGSGGTVTVTNFPAVQVITGSVGITTPIEVTVPQPLEVYIGGIQGISGGVVIQNWPAVIGVSGTFTSTPGPTNVYTSGLQGVSGSVSVSNLPAVQQVTGSIDSPIADTLLGEINTGIETLNSLVPSAYDYIAMVYNGSNLLTTASFYEGGSGGTLISSLVLTYDGSNNLIAVAKTPL